MKRQSLALFFVVAGLAVLPGCVRYKAKPLPKLAYKQVKGEVSASYHALTRKESKRYLGKDLLRKGIQPISLAVANFSEVFYIVDLSRLNVPYLSLEKVLEKLSNKTKALVLGAVAIFGIPALIYLGSGITLLACCNLKGAEYLAYGMILGFFSALTGIVAGAPPYLTNKKLTNDYAQKVFSQEPKVILPQHIEQGIVFVNKKDFDGTLSMTLTNAQTGDLKALQVVEVPFSLA